MNSCHLQFKVYASGVIANDKKVELHKTFRALGMSSIYDINLTGLDKGKMAANLGDAHEHIVAGILIRLGFDVGIVDVSGTKYDMLVIAFEKPPPDGKKVILRAQVRTASRSVSFIGGGRGGIDREYKSGVKTRKFTTKDSDLILAIDRSCFDVYVIPTEFIARWGNSKAISKMQPLKNNWDILLNWNHNFLKSLESKLPS